MSETEARGGVESRGQSPLGRTVQRRITFQGENMMKGILLASSLLVSWREKVVILQFAAVSHSPEVFFAIFAPPLRPLRLRLF